MALLRLSDGRVYTTLEDISRHIGSTRVGSFEYPEPFRKKVASLTLPLTEEGANYIFENLDSKVVSLLRIEGLVHRTIGCVIPPTKEGGGFVFAFGASGKDTSPQKKTAAEVKAYLTPHAVQVTDWHLCMSGAFVKGLQLEGDLQGVLYVQPGEWIRLNASVKNWPVFPLGQATVGVSFFDKQPGTFGQIDYPELKIKPEVLF